MPIELKVLVVDDHPIFRHGLVAVIENDADIKVVGEAENGNVAMELALRESPDVVILDIDMPEMDGIETAKALKTSSSNAKVIFLTMHVDKSILKSMNSLNVKGYVVKDSAINEIVRCIKLVNSGKTYLSPALNELILDNLARDSRDSDFVRLVSLLTRSEKRVLHLITDSKTNKEIAKELYVSVRTVESHRYNICSKLELNGNHALFKFAIRNKSRILELDAK